jgi:sugar phosphate isomerase/epimerase
MDRRSFLANASAVGLGLAAGLPDMQAQAEAPGMPYIVFTKHLKELSIEQLIDAMKAIDADGVDLCVRLGYPVNPDNAAEALPKAAEAFRAAGLSIPMVTAPTDLTNVSAPYAEGLFRACGEAGVKLLKPGYWSAPSGGYWDAVGRMKADVRAFAGLGRRYGVKPCLHTHSGSNMGLNAAALMHVLRDFEPEEVGAYLDVGHLAVCGEPPALAFAMAAEWLAVVGIKDMDRVRTDKGTQTRTVAMGEGFVDWPQVMAWLVEHNFRGPLTFHCEFPADNTETLLAQTRKDIAYLRGLG